MPSQPRHFSSTQRVSRDRADGSTGGAFAPSRAAIVLAAIVLLAGAIGCEPQGDPRTGAAGSAAGAPAPLRAAMHPCVLAGASWPAECGTLEVARDHRSDGDGGTLQLRVVRVRARGDGPQPDPLFLLAGGPGQAASEAFAPLLPALAAVGRERDLVMVDQRGTGASAPLDCDTPSDLPWLFRDGTLPDVAGRCATGNPHDPAHFSSQQAADDLEAVRRALGYGRINLLGVSYGTRLAMTYAARHPEATRSLVLDGVAPPELRIPLSFPRDAQDAFDKVAARCAAEPACRRAFPHVAADLDAVLAQLAQAPVQVRVRHPRTAQPVTLQLTRRVFADGVRGLLYAPELTALLPLALSSARRGDFAPFVAQVALLVEGAQRGGSTGLSLTLLCNEDLASLDEATLRQAAAGTFVGDAMADEMRQGCARWPRASMPALAPGWRSDAPALTLSGGLDPVTPPRWAEAALKHLPAGQRLTVPAAAHGVLARGCVPRLVAAFLNAPRAPVDSACTADYAPPAFFIDAAGPTTRATASEEPAP